MPLLFSISPSTPSLNSLKNQEDDKVIVVPEMMEEKWSQKINAKEKTTVMKIKNGEFYYFRVFLPSSQLKRVLLVKGPTIVYLSFKKYIGEVLYECQEF